MERKQNVVIKSVQTERYAISLVQLMDESYKILFGTSNQGKITKSEQIFSYSMASHLFDIKLAEFESNLH